MKQQQQPPAQTTMDRNRYDTQNEGDRVWIFGAGAADAEADEDAVAAAAAAAAERAIAEWGRRRSDITHVVSDCSAIHTVLPRLHIHACAGTGAAGVQTVTVRSHCSALARGAVLAGAAAVADGDPSVRILAVCTDSEAWLFRTPLHGRACDACASHPVFRRRCSVAAVVGSGAGGHEQRLYEVVQTCQRVNGDAEIHDPRNDEIREADARNMCSDICSNVEGLLDYDVAGCGLVAVHSAPHEEVSNPGVSVDAVLLACAASSPC